MPSLTKPLERISFPKDVPATNGTNQPTALIEKITKKGVRKSYYIKWAMPFNLETTDRFISLQNQCASLFERWFLQVAADFTDFTKKSGYFETAIAAADEPNEQEYYDIRYARFLNIQLGTPKYANHFKAHEITAIHQCYLKQLENLCKCGYSSISFTEENVRNFYNEKMLQEPIMADIFQFIAGPKSTTKYRTVTTLFFDKPIGFAVISKTILGYRFRQNFNTLTDMRLAIQPREESARQFAQLYVGAYVTGEGDLNPRNYGLDINRRLRKIDYDFTLYSELEIITTWDMLRLPFLYDANPAYFIDHNSSMGAQLTNETAYQTEKFYYLTKSILLTEAMIEQLVLNHVIDHDSTDWQAYRDQINDRLNQIKSKLLSMSEYRQFLKEHTQNKSIQNEIETEVAEYNQAISKNKGHRRALEIDLLSLQNSLTDLMTQCEKKESESQLNPKAEIESRVFELKNRFECIQPGKSEKIYLSIANDFAYLFNENIKIDENLAYYVCDLLINFSDFSSHIDNFYLTIQRFNFDSDTALYLLNKTSELRIHPSLCAYLLQSNNKSLQQLVCKFIVDNNNALAISYCKSFCDGNPTLSFTPFFIAVQAIKTELGLRTSPSEFFQSNLTPTKISALQKCLKLLTMESQTFSQTEWNELIKIRDTQPDNPAKIAIIYLFPEKKWIPQAENNLLQCEFNPNKRMMLFIEIEAPQSRASSLNHNTHT